MNKAITKEKNIDWSVDIEAFEGPLDLLLYLIKKNDLDIYEIPIAEITSEYLKYMDVMEKLSLDNAGDFLVMASILMSIKARTLLPSEQPDAEVEEDAEKMKQELIERLLEYKKYKESAQGLKEREKMYEGVVGLHQYPVKEFGQSVEATLFDLIDAFQKLVEKAQKDVKDILTEEFTVEDKIRFVMGKVEKQSSLTIKDLVEKNTSVLELIVTLLAVLELVRTHQIKVIQKTMFGTIHIESCE